MNSQDDLTPDHHLRDLLLGAVLGRHGPDDLAMLDHRDGVRDLHDLTQLVGDDNDGLALPLQFTEVVEELVHLLRREHGGGLVHDEDVHVAVEHLEDLDALARPDGYVLDLGAGVEVELVLLDESGNRPDLLLGVDEAQSLVQDLCPQQDVLVHGQARHELEVLVHHAQAMLDRIGGRAEAHLLAPDEDPPASGLQHAVEHVHEGGLAGAILADDALYLALPDDKVYVVVREKVPERLGQTHRLDDVSHGHAPPFRKIACGAGSEPLSRPTGMTWLTS